MPLVEREVSVQVTEKKDKFLPTVVKWKGENMVRNESFLAAVDEIVNWSMEIDVTRIGLVGDMNSGKTTLAEALAHSIHKRSSIAWAVKKFYERDLMNFEETLKNLKPCNYILIFDDVSFLDAKHNKTAINKVKESVTKIRHLEGGQDVKIILIYNYHYSKGLDKYLRMADFRLFLTVGSEEDTNMEGIVGTKMMGLVDFFSRARQKGVIKKYFPSPAKMKNKKTFAYKWRDPFIPVLFYNNQTLRMIISPTRAWLDPICSICSSANQEASDIDVSRFIKEFEEKYSPNTVKLIIKQFLKEQGINTYGKNYVSCRRYLDKALEMKTINLEDLALHYNFTPTVTKMRKKLDGVLIE